MTNALYNYKFRLVARYNRVSKEGVMDYDVVENVIIYFLLAAMLCMIAGVLWLIWLFGLGPDGPPSDQTKSPEDGRYD